jgi:AraC-like DNA-binding protein
MAMNFTTISYMLQLPAEASSSGGALVQAYLQAEPCRLSHCCQVFDKETDFYLPEGEDFIGLYINLGSEVRYVIDGYPPAALHKNFFTMLYVPERHCKIHVSKGRYAAMSISLTRGHVKLLARQFPNLHAFLEHVERREAAMTHSQSLPLAPELLLTINNVFTNTFTGFNRETYFQSKILDIVLGYLEHSNSAMRILNIDPNTRPEQKKLHEACDYIARHSQRPYSVGYLADKFGVDERKLADHFKMIYGQTIYKFQHEERMKKAVALIRDTNKPIKEIATASGYKNIYTFSEAFKNRYGYCPTTLRKRDPGFVI